MLQNRFFEKIMTKIKNVKNTIFYTLMERRKRVEQVSWHHSNPVADLFFEIPISKKSQSGASVEPGLWLGISAGDHDLPSLFSVESWPVRKK